MSTEFPLPYTFYDIIIYYCLLSILGLYFKRQLTILKTLLRKKERKKEREKESNEQTILYIIGDGMKRQRNERTRE